MTNRPTPSDLVAARVQALRQRRDWSARDLAERCAELGANQLTAAVIANIETGRRDASGRRRRDVSVDELLALSQALEVPPFDLIQIPAAAGFGNAQITPLVAASRDQLASWMRGLSAFVPLTPLDGFALCGSCRNTISIRGSQDGYRFYCANRSCKSPVTDCPAEPAIGRTLEVLAEFIRTEDFREALSAAETDPPAESLESRIVALYLEIDSLEDRRASAIRDLEDLAEHPELNAKVVSNAISSFDRRINDLWREITEARRRLSGMNSIVVEVDEAIEILPARSLQILMATIMTVVITPTCDIEIEWRWEQKE